MIDQLYLKNNYLLVGIFEKSNDNNIKDITIRIVIKVSPQIQAFVYKIFHFTLLLIKNIFTE